MGEAEGQAAEGQQKQYVSSFPWSSSDHSCCSCAMSQSSCSATVADPTESHIEFCVETEVRQELTKHWRPNTGEQDPPTTSERSVIMSFRDQKAEENMVAILWLKHWMQSSDQQEILLEDPRWINNDKPLGREDWWGARDWLCKWHQLSHLLFPMSLWD